MVLWVVRMWELYSCVMYLRGVYDSWKIFNISYNTVITCVRYLAVVDHLNMNGFRGTFFMVLALLDAVSIRNEFLSVKL